MGKNKKDKIIMRHVLEVKLEKRIFSFIDYRGELVDFLIKNLNGENIRIMRDGTRIDIASKDLSKVYFIGYESLGLQIDGVDSFEVFIGNVKKLFGVLKDFGKYNPESIIRIGTRSSILYHHRGDSFDGIKEKYKNMVFANYKNMETKTNSILNDVAYTFEFKRDNGRANILTGPVTKEESIQKFFKNEDHYKNFEGSNGLYFDIDFSKSEKKEYSIDQLEKDIENNISNVKEIFEGLITYFEVNEDYGR
jgi:hypothetical protein